MALKPAAAWSRSTLEWCAINQLGVDKKTAKAAGFRDGKLMRLYQKALDDRAASVSAASGLLVEAGDVKKITSGHVCGATFPPKQTLS